MKSDCCNAEVNANHQYNPSSELGFTVMYDCKNCGSACTVHN